MAGLHRKVESATSNSVMDLSLRAYKTDFGDRISQTSIDTFFRTVTMCCFGNMTGLVWDRSKIYDLPNLPFVLPEGVPNSINLMLNSITGDIANPFRCNDTANGDLTQQMKLHAKIV